MKRCPACNRTYADETLTYCLADGSLLSAPYNPEVPERLAPLPARNLPATEVLPAAASPLQSRPKNNRLLYLIIVVLALIIGGGAVILFKFINREGLQHEPLTKVTPTSPSPTVSSPSDTPKIAPTNTPKETTVNENQAAGDKSDPSIKGQLPVPKIYGMTYDAARKILIREGWQPNKQHWSHGDSVDVKSGNGPIFWDRGYWELDSCSGTGLAHCRFQFSDPSQRILVVITEGEEDEAGKYHAKVNQVFFDSK